MPRMKRALSLLLLAASCAGQSEECKKFIECRRAYDEEAGNQPADLARWEEAGDCWVDGETASACTEQGVEELADVREAVDDGGFEIEACEA